MAEDMEQIVRASLERMALAVKAELTTLSQSVHQSSSTDGPPRLNDGVAAVARMYQQIAADLFAQRATQPDAQRTSAIRQHDQLPEDAKNSSGGAQPAAGGKAGQASAWQNGDIPHSSGPGTPPARTLSGPVSCSGPVSSTSPPVENTTSAHDIAAHELPTPLEELLLLSSTSNDVARGGILPGSQHLQLSTDLPARDSVHASRECLQQQQQQQLAANAETQGLFHIEPASGPDSGSNSVSSTTQLSSEMAQLLRSMQPQNTALEQSLLHANNLGDANGMGASGANSEGMWGSQTPLEAFVRAQDAHSGQLMHQSISALSADNDMQAVASANGSGFGRFVSAGASASPSFLKSVHAALTAGNLGKTADGGSDRSAPAGLSTDALTNRGSSARLPPPPPPMRQGSGIHTGSASGPLYVVGDSQQESRQRQSTPSSTMQSSSHGSMMALGGEGGRNNALSASLVAQHNMLQQVVQQQQLQQQQQAVNQQLQQQQQQHAQLQQLQQQAQQQQQQAQQQQFLFQQQQQQQEKLQQQQQQLLLAHEQQRLAHELQLEQQLEQLHGAGLVQYTDARALLNGTGNNQQITYQVDPVTGNMVALMPSADGNEMYRVNNVNGAVNLTQLGQQDRSGNFNQNDPNAFSLFDLQPPQAPGSGSFLPNSAQHTLSMFAAAAGSRTYKSPSPTPSQQLDLQGHANLSANGLSSLLGTSGHQVAGSTPVSAHTLSLAQMPMLNTGNSEPLPMLMGNGAYGNMLGGNYVPSTHQTSNPDLAFLSQRLLGAAGNAGGLMAVGTGTGTNLSPGQRLLVGGGVTGLSLSAARTGLGGTPPSSPLTARGSGEMPGRFKVLPVAVQQRIMALCRSNPVITIRDFDEKVVSKLSLLVDSWGTDQALAMLEHLEHRMRTKQGAMKNGPGYLDVAVCSHLDMLKAQGTCPKSMKLDEYAQQVLAPPVFHELCEAVNGNRWLAWEHFDQGIIQLVKRLPSEGAVEKLQEITYHSFKNVDNIKGCIMSILNSKIREDRRRQ